MPTPASGAISMDDMRTHINRATTSAISMSEMRDRYGGSGAISFSDLRNCEGFVASPSTYASKFVNLDGWELRIWGFGSVSPNEATGIQIAANSYIGGMTAGTGTNTDANILLYSNTTIESANGTYTAGYNATNITRIVTANTSRTLGTATAEGSRPYTYDWPTSGTVHCLVKF